jgi:hypothetical protein
MGHKHFQSTVGPAGPFKIELAADVHGAGDDTDLIYAECC